MSATNLVTGQVYEFDYPASDPNITWVGLQYLFDDRFALSCDEMKRTVTPSPPSVPFWIQTPANQPMSTTP